MTHLTLMIELLKKGIIWQWSNECQDAFEELKVTITKGPILGLVYVMKLFEVETDTLDYALGGVLL